MPCLPISLINRQKGHIYVYDAEIKSHSVYKVSHYWQGHWLSSPGPCLWKDSVSTDYNLTGSNVSQKVFSSSMNPSQNPGFIQAAKEFFEKFKDCANVILGKESTANKQWTREKYFYTERTSFILLYFYSKNHLQPKHNTRRCARTNIPQSERLLCHHFSFFYQRTQNACWLNVKQNHIS